MAAKPLKPRKSQGKFYIWVKRMRMPVTLAILCCVLVFALLPYSIYADISRGSIDVPSVSFTPALPSESILAPVSPTPSLTASPEVNSQVTYRLGDTAPEIELIQLRLMNLCYLSADEPSERFSAPLEEAVRLFQRAHHLTQTGEADPMLCSLLFSDNAQTYLMEYSNCGNDVLMLQQRLSQLGYYSDKQNGYFGTATRNALIKFQSLNDLEINGTADRMTFDTLFSADAVNLVQETPAPSPSPSPAPATPRPVPSATPTPRPSQGTPSPGPSNTPSPAPTPEPTSEPTPLSSPSPDYTPAPGSLGLNAFITALNAQLGKPYIYGASGPNAFDCSGLVYYCLDQAGVNIGRLNSAGYASYSGWDKITSISSLKKGDLIFYYNSSFSAVSHVAVYLGGGTYIHASTSQGIVCTSTIGEWSETYFAWGRRVFD